MQSVAPGARLCPAGLEWAGNRRGVNAKPRVWRVTPPCGTAFGPGLGTVRAGSQGWNESCPLLVPRLSFTSFLPPRVPLHANKEPAAHSTPTRNQGYLEYGPRLLRPSWPFSSG